MMWACVVVCFVRVVMWSMNESEEMYDDVSEAVRRCLEGAVVLQKRTAPQSNGLTLSLQVSCAVASPEAAYHVTHTHVITP